MDRKAISKNLEAGRAYVKALKPSQFVHNERTLANQLKKAFKAIDDLIKENDQLATNVEALQQKIKKLRSK